MCPPFNYVPSFSNIFKQILAFCCIKSSLNCICLNRPLISNSSFMASYTVSYWLIFHAVSLRSLSPNLLTMSIKILLFCATTLNKCSCSMTLKFPVCFTLNLILEKLPSVYPTCDLPHLRHNLSSPEDNFFDPDYVDSIPRST